MPDNEIILGIDLGTTFATAAYVDDYGRPVVIPNAEGEKTTPSVVLIENGQILVGKAAASQIMVKPEQVVQWIKRSIGDLDYQFQGLGPIEISAEILKKIKADCEQYFGEKNPAAIVRKAVITCPAYFSANEVENTMKAGQLAGFDVQEIVREPTAAAIYYGVEHMKEGSRVLVCDLGGGTFDASILAFENATFRPLATAGDRQLGGHDWTSDLRDLVVDSFTDIFGENPRMDPVVEQYLYDSCEQLKRDFARLDQGVVTCTYKNQTAEVLVTRAEFERLTEWRVREVLDWAEKALAKSIPPLTWQEIDSILLVGGSTRLRRISEALEQLSGKKPVQTSDADTIVALGAALLARGAYRPRRPAASSGVKKSPISGLTLLPTVLRTAVRNFGTRVIVRTNKGWEIQNSVVIPYGESLPTQKTREDFHISFAGQPFFDVPVVEFDDIGSHAIQQTYRFDCPPGLPKGTSVHVTFHYDQSGQIDVEGVECHSNTALSKQRVAYQEPDLNALASPRRIVFALDVSGSMTEYHKIDRARQAVMDTAEKLFASGGGLTEIGVVAFGSQAQVVCTLTSDAAVLQQAVKLLRTYGTTAMHSGLSLAYDMLSKVDKNTQRLILLVSDGMPDLPAETITVGGRILSDGIELFLVSLGSEGINEAFLKELSLHTFYVDDPDQLSITFINLLGLNTPAAPTAQSGITWLEEAEKEIVTPNVPTEQISFTAYHPKEGRVESWHTLLVYTHVSAALAKVQEDAKRFDDQIRSPKETTSKSSTPVARGMELAIVPSCDNVTFNPERVSFNWMEDFHRADFRFKADKTLSGDAAKGQITIYAGPLIIGTLKFAMVFNDEESHPVADHEEHAKMYGKDDVFISYSRKDTEVARVFKTILSATGMDVFLDVDNLRSGQLWQEELLHRIKRAGIFQMFWSENYSQSENCRMEWQYALQQNKGEGYIRPVYWKTPLSPTPPEELGKFNFQFVELKTVSTE